MPLRSLMLLKAWVELDQLKQGRPTEVVNLQGASLDFAEMRAAFLKQRRETPSWWWGSDEPKNRAVLNTARAMTETPNLSAIKAHVFLMRQIRLIDRIVEGKRDPAEMELLWQFLHVYIDEFQRLEHNEPWIRRFG